MLISATDWPFPAKVLLWVFHFFWLKPINLLRNVFFFISRVVYVYTEFFFTDNGRLAMNNPVLRINMSEKTAKKTCFLCLFYFFSKHKTRELNWHNVFDTNIFLRQMHHNNNNVHWLVCFDSHTIQRRFSMHAPTTKLCNIKSQINKWN